MDLNSRIRLWNQLHIQVLDVRHTALRAGERTYNYRLPSSAFLYALHGQAQLQWDEDIITVHANMILHGGKGLCMTINAETDFNYYIILYKASLPKFTSRELLYLMEENNPFTERYCLMCRHPLMMQTKLLDMKTHLNAEQLRDRLLVKATFYQLVHEVFRQLDEQKIKPLVPDQIYQTVRYMEDYYKEAITLEQLADQIDCSPRTLLRRFKQIYRKSPIDYLIGIRLDQAKRLLLDTNLSVRDISEDVGYSDYYYFSRIFKKHIGVSPVKFRLLTATHPIREENPSTLSISSIAGSSVPRYYNIENDNHYQHYKEGEFTMYSKTRNSLAILVICAVMLLSACGAGNTGSNNGGNASSNNNSAVTTPVTTDEATEGQSRVIKHAMGETTIEGTPERVVILTNEGTEALLAVGVKPVGAVQSWIGDPWYEHISEGMEGVEVVGDELQPNIELIASLKPDLIIGNKVRQEKIYDQLSEIAPTVFSEDLAGDWKINFDLYVDVLNKQDEGDRLMEEFDKRVEEASVKLQDKLDTKVSIARFTASQVRIYQKQTFAGVLLNQLGFARPESQDKDAFIEVMSKETIPSMDGDVLFYFVSEDPGKDDAAKVVEEWMNDPLFQNLSVVKNDKVIKVDEAIWNTAGGYKAANLLLDEIIAYFE